MFPEPEFVALASNPRKAVLLQVHDKLDIFGPDGLDEAQSATRVSIMRCMFSKRSEDTNKKGDAKGWEGEFSLTYFMQRLSNSETPLIEIDLFNQIHRVQGVDVWPE
jgi:phage tail tube protein FII